MKATGIVRKVDELGRIVLPIELRRTLDIMEKDSIEVFLDGKLIVLRKYELSCTFCESVFLPEQKPLSKLRANNRA